jgi:NADPH2:quinone reductase
VCAVGSLAAQLARWGGANVIGTVTRERDLDLVNPGIPHAVALDQRDPVDAIRDNAPAGVDRIIELAFSDNADLDAAVAANDAVIAAYATRHDRPEIPFWPMLFANLTIGLLGSDDSLAAANTKLPPTSPLRHAREPCQYPSAIRYRSSKSQKHTTESTPAPANACS